MLVVLRALEPGMMALQSITVSKRKKEKTSGIKLDLFRKKV